MAANVSPSTFFRPLLPWTALFAGVVVLLGATRLTHPQAVDEKGRIFFVDADCYARMTRVREVCSTPGTVLRCHDFENYPLGTTPHTTVPLDYLAAGLNGIFAALHWKDPRDLAGAWISPLLGIFALVAVWMWTRRESLSGGGVALGLFAASPIVAHGFAYARPDHQSLEITCLALALTGEWRQWVKPSRAWSVVGGIGWGVGLWTSLYEPLIVAVLVGLVGLVFGREKLLRRERLPGLVVCAALLLAAWVCEGWRLEGIPGFGEAETGAGYFAAWSRQISELQSLTPWSATLYHWTGWGFSPRLLRFYSFAGKTGLWRGRTWFYSPPCSL